jgi:hypothetical protein
MKFRLSISSAIAFVTVGSSFYVYNPFFYDSISNFIAILQFSAAISLIVGLPIFLKKEEAEQTSLAKLGTSSAFAIIFVALSSANLFVSLFFDLSNLSLSISVFSIGLLLFYLNSQGMIDALIEKNQNELHGTLIHLQLRNEVHGLAASCKDGKRKMELQKLGDELGYLPNLTQRDTSASLAHAVQALVANAYDSDEEEFFVLKENLKSEINIFRIKNSKSTY